MANANKNKGKRGERMICDHLAEVFGLPFQRTPCSGAFTGGSNAWRKKSMSDSQQLLANGDIIVPDELSNLSFEIKTYKDFSFNTIFTTNSVLDKWIDQASACGKIWFLIFNINHAGSYVVFHKKHYFNPSDSYAIYKNDFVVCSMNNFFESNKDTLLHYGKMDIKSIDDSQTIALSPSV